jgi:N-acetylglucosamine-6-phosphate deacetylase
MELIAWATARGKRVAIGHSAAEGEILAQAVATGASLSTHLGNGLPPLLPKLANPLMAQLANDALTATVIADGVHVPIDALRVILRAKGASRVILVTDAVSAAKATPGVHPFAGFEVELAADGSVRLPGRSNLAGSALALDQAIRNLVAWGLASPREALRYACANTRAALAAPLSRHGRDLPPSFVEWQPETLWPRRVHLGSEAIAIDRPI